MATVLKPEFDEASQRNLDSVIRVDDVHKYYDLGEAKVHALRGVSLDVQRGEFVAIMGSSGSGKSTFMNMLGCLDKATTGRYSLNGTDVSELEKKELAAIRNRELGFVFQGFNLLSRTTAQANVELPMIYGGVTAGERARRAREALERVGLGNRMDHFPNQLSGGQQQRVAIARALVTTPSIVLADEPTGNLDSRSGVEVMAMLQELNAEGITVVLVTHDANVARHAQRVVHLKDGLIVREELVDDRVNAIEELAAMATAGAGEKS